MKFIVSSNIDYYKVTVETLVTSLINTGIDPTDILVSIGRSSHESIESKDGVTYHFNNFDCFEYNAVFSMRQLNIRSEFFLMHDTCLVGPQFLKLLNSKLNELDRTRVIALRPASGGLYSNTIGYYPNRFIDIMTEQISYINDMPYSIDKKHEVMKYEDYWFKIDNHRQAFCTTENLINSETLTNRIGRYFPELDFKKFQANHAYSKLRIEL